MRADILCKKQSTYHLENLETTCLLNAQFNQFTVLRVYGKFRKFTKFTALQSENGTLRILGFYRFSGHFSGTTEFSMLRFYCFTACLGKRRAVAPRFAHRHHSPFLFRLKNAQVNNADGLPTAVMEEVPKDLSEQVDDGLTWANP